MNINLSKVSIFTLRDTVNDIDNAIDSFVNCPYYLCNIFKITGAKCFTILLFESFFEIGEGISVGKKIYNETGDPSYLGWEENSSAIRMRLMMLAMLREYVATEIEARKKHTAKRRKYNDIANLAEKIMEELAVSMEKYPEYEYFVCTKFYKFYADDCKTARETKKLFQEFFDVGNDKYYTFGCKFGLIFASRPEIKMLNEFRLLALAVFIEYYRSLAK